MIKTFKKFINEGKERFINTNKNLTRQQKALLIKFFEKNRQAEKLVNDEFGWQKAATTMTYDDFQGIMMRTKSGRKTTLNCSKIKVKGSKEGTDYVRLVLKNKNFCAFVPFNYETAKIFNTKELGVCNGPWCIGSTKDAFHWNSEVIEEQSIPVYVISTESKWIVMIYDDNRSYKVWDVDNDTLKQNTKIDGFDVKKELLTPSLKKLYDKIRNNYYDHFTYEFNKIDDEYNRFITDIETKRNNPSMNLFYPTVDKEEYENYANYIFSAFSGLESYIKAEDALHAEITKYIDNPIKHESKFKSAKELLNHYGFTEPPKG